MRLVKQQKAAIICLKRLTVAYAATAGVNIFSRKKKKLPINMHRPLNATLKPLNS
jgi:hypothetical protein